jgi:hypothetical protein
MRAASWCRGLWPATDTALDCCVAKVEYTQCCYRSRFAGAEGLVACFPFLGQARLGGYCASCCELTSFAGDGFRTHAWVRSIWHVCLALCGLQSTVQEAWRRSLIPKCALTNLGVCTSMSVVYCYTGCLQTSVCGLGRAECLNSLLPCCWLLLVGTCLRFCRLSVLAAVGQ